MDRVSFRKAGALPLVALVVIFWGLRCSTSNSLLQPEQLIERGVVTPGADLESLRRGRALAVTECTGCHRLYWPNEYSPKEWTGIVRKMGARSSLSDSQMRDLESYYVSASQAAERSYGEKSDAKQQSPK
jgi:hypothetical protein